MPGRGARRLQHIDVMGTVVVVELRLGSGGDEEGGARGTGLALARVRGWLERVDATFSTWKPQSPMSRLRRGEVSLEEVPADVRTVLELCDEARARTEGWFDHEKMPGGVDPTGLVKGWAARRAVEILRESGFADVMVNAGGDVATAGEVDGGPWRVGIRHPRDPGAVVAVLASPGAVATSGTYERGAHLVDPRSGKPSAALASATVTGPDLAFADAAATALAVAGVEGLEFVESWDGYEALAILPDGTEQHTSRLPLLSE
jgi:thiamine biosynthesis lipoprotein